MCSKLLNEPVEALFPPKVEADKKDQKTVVSLTADHEYVDQDKLVKPSEGETKPEVSKHRSLV